MRPTAPFATRLKLLAILLLMGMCAGCATTPLERARHDFYSGRAVRAEADLAALPDENKDRVLFLMERGMVRQSLGKYEESAADWRSAAELIELLETYSISRGAASLLSNDRVLSFRGKPFERTLLFTFLAVNYLAMHDWDYASICARNIIQHLENLDGFPDIAFSRYMAGFCLDLIDDTGNAALQYRTASGLLADIEIDENTGALSPAEEGNSAGFQKKEDASFEFVCFTVMGRAYCEGEETGHFPTESAVAEFYQDDVYLGRSYEFDRVDSLAQKTAEQIALQQVVKEISRVALKETISQTIEQQNELLGFLTRLTLFALEAPDTRRWETLPMRLQIARLPCARPVTNYTVIFKDSYGNTLHTKTVTSPITRRGNIFISFCRDIPHTLEDDLHLDNTFERRCNSERDDKLLPCYSVF